MRQSQYFGRFWSVALVVLVVVFATAGVLNMMQLRVAFFTTHAADLSGPALLYIQFRKSWQQGSTRLLSRVFGQSPEITAGALFFGSTVTELSQILYPHGVFSGRFDPWDIVAFALGLGVCFLLEKAGVGMVRLGTDEVR